MTIRAILRSKFVYVTLVVIVLTVFNIYILPKSQVFLKSIQYTGNQNRRWNSTTLFHHEEEQANQIATRQYLSPQIASREYPSPQIDDWENPIQQIATKKFPNPQIATIDPNPQIATRENPNPQIATRVNPNPLIATKEYKENTTQLINEEEKKELGNHNYFYPNNSNVHLAIYEYVIKITNMKKKLYLDLLWKTIKVQNFSSVNLTTDLKEVPFPCIIPEKLRLCYEQPTADANAISFLVTASPLGRLGNVMGEYATLYALGKLYNISVFLQPKMKVILSSKFPHISMKELPLEFKGKHCTQLSYDGFMYNYKPIEVAAAGLFGTGCFILKEYPFEMRLFQAVKEDIFREFRFSSDTSQTMEDFLQSVKSSVLETKNASAENFNPTFISVHVRRTDYMKHFKKLFGGKISDKSYLIKALAIARQNYPNPIFVATSDDKKYLNKNFGSEKDFFITPDGVTPDVDMAIMSSCNHSIFTVGSFGFWGSFLAGGNVYYADFVRKKPYRFSTRFYKEANLTNFLPIRVYDEDSIKR